MFKARAMVHSLKEQDIVTILHEKDCNDVVAEYKGKRYRAIFNGFVCLYYVDDLYGLLPDQNRCPACGNYILNSQGNYTYKITHNSPYMG